MSTQKKVCSSLDRMSITARERHLDEVADRVAKKFGCDETVEVTEDCIFDDVVFRRGMRGIIRVILADEFVGGIIGISVNFASQIVFIHEDYIKKK